jgi:hypothetical protein
MWLDYMHDNKAEIIKKVGDSEYHKMLKDGMVNVKPGTTLMLDEHDPLKIKLHDIGGKISHLHGQHSIGGHASVPILENVPTGEVPTQDATDAVNNAQWSSEVLENQKAVVDSASEQYGKVLNNDFASGGVLQQDYVSERTLRAAMESAKNGLAEITSNPEGSYGRTLRNVLKTFSDKNLSEWNRIEKLPAANFLIPGGSTDMGSLSQEARAAIMAHAKLVPPKNSELMGRWVIRFMQAAKEGTIKSKI